MRPFGPQILIGYSHGSRKFDGTGSQGATRDRRKKNKFCAHRNHAAAFTMRLSDARLHCRETKLLYFNHRPPPWSTVDATRDRSNRLSDGSVPGQTKRQRWCAKYEV